MYEPVEDGIGKDRVAEVIWYGLYESSSLAEDLARKESPAGPHPFSA